MERGPRGRRRQDRQHHRRRRKPLQRKVRAAPPCKQTKSTYILRSIAAGTAFLALPWGVSAGQASERTRWKARRVPRSPRKPEQRGCVRSGLDIRFPLATVHRFSSCWCFRTGLVPRMLEQAGNRRPKVKVARGPTRGAREEEERSLEKARRRKHPRLYPRCRCGLLSHCGCCGHTYRESRGLSAPPGATAEARIQQCCSTPHQKRESVPARRVALEKVSSRGHR